MAAPIGNSSLNVKAPSSIPTETKKTEKTLEDTLETRVNTLMKNISEFINEIKGLPNFLQEIPEGKQDKLEQLTKEAHELLGLHPVFKLENAKVLHQQMKADYKTMTDEMEKAKSDMFKGLVEANEEESKNNDEENDEFKPLMDMMKGLPLSSLMFDCGGMLKMQEKQMKMLELGVKELDKVIRFQEDSKNPLSKEIKFPLIEVSLSIQRLLDSGLFQ